MYGFVASEGVSECYGLVWCSKCPYWKISERQNSTHLTLLKHQNTKTSLYKLSKNHWVIALFKKIGSVRKRLQSTVSLDHPVSSNWHFSTVFCTRYRSHCPSTSKLCPVSTLCSFYKTPQKVPPMRRETGSGLRANGPECASDPDYREL